MLHGHIHPDFHPLARALERQLSKTSGGAAVCVYHEGECVADLWGGYRDAEGTLWERDTMSVSYSTTKGVTSTALHLLADRGLVDYDAPVADYWPEFAAAGKQDITVRDVMCHRAGMFNIRDLIDDARRMLEWDYMIEALARAPAATLPGTASAYQALTYGYLVGEIIQRASGRALGELVQTEIAEPLGLDGLYIGVPAEQLHRAARLIDFPGRKQTNGSGGNAKPSRSRRRRELIARALQVTLRAVGHPVDLGRAAAALVPRGIGSFDFSSDEVLQASIPAANGMFTARSLARLYAALANGGELDGVRLMTPETIERATQIQVRGYDQITLFPMRWRLGYHRVGTMRGVPRRAFGHFGYGGSGAWADPVRNMSVAMTLNSGGGTPMGDFRMLRMNTVALACARQRWRKLQSNGRSPRP